jgi:hypothetical protein
MGFGHVPPPITTHLNVFRWSIVNSNSEHRVLCPKNCLNLHENLLEIYLKLLVSNYWGGGRGCSKNCLNADRRDKNVFFCRTGRGKLLI